MSHTMAIQRFLSFSLVLLVAGIFLIASSQSQEPKPVTTQGPVVINKTKGLAVISAVRNGDELYIAFRNDYSKNIIAYAISIGNSRITEDFAYSGFTEAGILPGTTHERRISFAESTKPVKIEAIVLDDGSAQGDDIVIQEIKDSRLGSRIQIERTLRLLNNYLKSTNSPTKAAVGELKSRIVSRLDASEADSLAALKQLQPGRPWNSLSEQAKNALQNGKQTVLLEFQAAENSQDTAQELLRLKNYWGKSLAKTLI